MCVLINYLIYGNTTIQYVPVKIKNKKTTLQSSFRFVYQFIKF